MGKDRCRRYLFFFTWILGVQLCFVLGEKQKVTSAKLWELWPKVRISPADPYQLRSSDVTAALEGLQKKNPKSISVEFTAKSAEGRPLPLVQWGQGELKIALWSQMHGDEPTATAALLDILHFLVSNPGNKLVRQWRDRLHLLILPMLNPDGAERTRRRNAQGIDINRDALALTTPEGRFLKQVRDRFQPEIGFNLHNQNARTSVGETKQPAMISLLAVPYDAQGNNNEGRIRSKKICALIYETLGPYCYTGIARYDDSFTVRAFGDQMSAWGTYTVLIESGWPGRGGEEYLVRVNFLAILRALQALADGSIQNANPAVYDALLQNQSDLIFDWILRGVTIWSGNAVAPFITDLGINFRDVWDDPKQRRKKGAVAEVGDLSVFRGLRETAAAEWIACPSDLGAGPPKGEITPGTQTLFLYRKKSADAAPVAANLLPVGRLAQGTWVENP